MLRMTLLHPEILQALGASGHGSKVLIADGNYPFDTGSHPGARRVYLNFAPGKLTVTEILAVLITVIPIETAEVMMPDSGREAPIFLEFRSLLPGLELKALERLAFYDQARSPKVCLVIATGEQRTYGNLLLTIGVVTPD
jgi:L-fucose mutarotase